METSRQKSSRVSRFVFLKMISLLCSSFSFVFLRNNNCKVRTLKNPSKGGKNSVTASVKSERKSQKTFLSSFIKSPNKVTNIMADSKTVLIVGATGATGKHVVQILLDQGHVVKVVARSKERMLSLLNGNQDKNDRLQVKEAAILDLKQSELNDLVKDCDAVVSCLGHNLTREGIWGKANRRLVKDSVKRLVKAIEDNTTEKSTKKCKFVLMGSDGVAHPNDDKRSAMERGIIFLLRHLLPPHADNEEAAAFLLNDCNDKSVEWSVVRPTDLQDGDMFDYEIFPKPQGSLFGSGIATRANVAKFMVDLVLKEDMWSQYRHQMPVLHDAKDSTKN